MEEEQIETIAYKMKTAMTEAGMTQEALGRKIGITQAQVNYWVTGSRIPTLESLQKIADALNKPLDYFTSKIVTSTQKFVEIISYDTSLIPVKGTSSASKAKFVLEETEAYLPIKKTNREQFAIRVEGDCMVDPEDPQNSIYQGNYVIIDCYADVEDGDVVLARISEEYSTIKRYYRVDAENVELVPDNPKYKAIRKKMNDLKIIGKVVHVYKPSKRKIRRRLQD